MEENNREKRIEEESIRDDNFNRAKLLQLLNEKNVFDRQMALDKGDRLLLSFQVEGGQVQERIDYGFEYTCGTWMDLDVDLFKWMRDHAHISSGSIQKR